MSDPFVAEIRILPFNFAPLGWAFCDGQIQSIAQNTALFSLLGTNYGGNGTTNFALPDLRGRAPMQPRQGPGLSLRDLGEQSGAETHALTVPQMPQHNHAGGTTVGTLACSTGPGTSNGANTRFPAVTKRPLYAEAGASNVVSGLAGSGAAHENMQPYLTLSYCIATQGIYPARS